MSLTRRFFLAGLGGTIGYGLGRQALASTPAKQTIVDSTNTIQVRAKPKASQGTLKFAGNTYKCMVGKSGIVSSKFEGDGGTPSGPLSYA